MPNMPPQILNTLINLLRINFIFSQEDGVLLEYLLRFVIRLRPLAAAKKVDILKRLLAALTHQSVMINENCLPTKKDFPR